MHMVRCPCRPIHVHNAQPFLYKHTHMVARQGCIKRRCMALCRTLHRDCVCHALDKRLCLLAMPVHCYCMNIVMQALCVLLAAPSMA